MALIIYGKSSCSLCGQTIERDDAVVSFPAFVVNELDPCFALSDGSFHEACLHKDVRAGEALRRVEEWAAHVGPGKRQCAVCGMQVVDPDNYILIEHLSERDDDPLSFFNYVHLHRTCIPKWDARVRFDALAKDRLASGAWKGSYLPHLIEQIGAAAADKPAGS